MPLLSFRGVLAFWIAYGILHALFRLAISPTLALDDARASELVQNLALGYQVRQPPLYEWLLWCSQQIFGSGISSHLFIRYSLIAALGLATFGAARAAAKDERWAALAALSLVFSYPVGWTFHEWATQTILLSIACMATLHAAIRYFERPGAGTAGLLGLALALGFYAKFSFPLFLAGLGLAALSLKEWRGRLFDRHLLLSGAIALVLLSPYLYWLASVKGDIAGSIAGHMIAGDGPHWQRALYGLRRLALSLPLFLLPWLLFVALLAPAAFLRRQADAPAPNFSERLVLRTMIFAAVLAALGIAVIGATNIAERYMHPILIVAPVYVFARVVRLAPNEQYVRRFAAFALAAAVFMFGFRLLSVSDNPLTRSAGRALLLPYGELAAALKERGIAAGTVITPEVREAGNLRAFLPNVRVIAGDSFRAQRPARRASDESSCVLVWTLPQQSAARRLAMQDALAAEPIEIPARPTLWVARRAGAWFIARLDPKSPACS